MPAFGTLPECLWRDRTEWRAACCLLQSSRPVGATLISSPAASLGKGAAG